MQNPATYLLTPQIKQAIAQHAKSTPNEEICGVIADGKVVRCRNAALDPANDFELNAEDWLSVKSSAVEVQAVYHSHWSDTHPEHLSGQDIAQAKMSGLPYVMHHVGFGGWDLFDPRFPYPYPLLLLNGGNPKSIEFYTGWQYEWNRADCWTLVWAYYNGMLEIPVADANRSHKDLDASGQTLRDGWDRYREELPERGFVNLPDGTPYQDHDLVIMRLRSAKLQAHHIGIICDAKKGHMLHHYGYPRLSERIVFGGYWRDASLGYGLWRHKDLMQ